MKELMPANSPQSLRYFLGALIVVATIGGSLALYSFFAALISSYELTFCIKSGCLTKFFESQNETKMIVEGTLKILVSISTIGAIIVALLSYINTTRATALTNHIAHLRTFQDYVLNEVDKLTSLSKSSLNTLVWYNVIYEQSRTGEMHISDRYKECIEKVNEEIKTSNSYSEEASQPSFNYKDHQTRLIEVTNSIGISLARDTRASFFESEEQIFSLLDNVNSEFCGENSLVIHKRKYK